jgi:hypothetical protein
LYNNSVSSSSLILNVSSSSSFSCRQFRCTLGQWLSV